MNIRLEQPQDYREVELLTREAFWNVYRPGCTEHYVLHCYRQRPQFIPDLAFVMEHDGRLIGHVMFSKAALTCDDGTLLSTCTFGPLSIHPDYQRKGFGCALLRHALTVAKDLGYGAVCMEGNIDFYRHASFVVASSLGIHYHGEPRDSDVPYFLAQELLPGFLHGRECTYRTPAGYFVADDDPAAFAAFDATFPPKEKEVRPGQLWT